jgi:dephospho-CoA kinase
LIVVGITGKYCSGKNTASDLLAAAGYAEIDVDSLGHQALRDERDRILDRFGSHLAAGDDDIDRRELGRIVFADRNALKDLELIVHPAMTAAVEHRIAELRSLPSPPPGVAVNAAILFRMDLTRLCDLVLYIHARFRTRYRRARERDNARFMQVVRRLASQRDVAPQHSGPNADIHSVQNDGSREQLLGKLKAILPLS